MKRSQAVYQEVTQDLHQPGARKLSESPWLRVVEVQDNKVVDRLRFWLDQGESEGIALAQGLDLFRK